MDGTRNGPDTPPVVDLAAHGDADPTVVGEKAAALAALAAAGLPVPPGIVVTGAVLGLPAAEADRVIVEAAAGLGTGPFAVRSSSPAEDLPDASYAGLYETVLDVAPADVPAAVRRCFASAAGSRVRAYREHRDGAARSGFPAMAVLIQPMVAAGAAGVAFTAHPLTGARDQVVVTAVTGTGERLVSGQDGGEEWTVRGTRAERTGTGAPVLEPRQARAVAELARRVAALRHGPQDVEWALAGDRTVLLQARPMTALPEPARWRPPGPGLWLRNLRIGEWLPEATTPLFADWLLPRMEAGYLAGMQLSVGAVVPFRYAVVDGWYYNALPVPSPRLLLGVLARGRGRAVRFVFDALIRVSRNPVAADRALLAGLEREWRTQILPGYRGLVGRAGQEVDAAGPARLHELVDEIGDAAGRYLWYLAVVGGSAWKIEACLARFAHRHLPGLAADGPQVLLTGLPGAEPAVAAHAVQSLDWYHPTAGELGGGSGDPDGAGDRRRQVRAARLAAEQDCRDALADRSHLLARFTALLRVAQRYAVVREQQARDLTLGWPVLRRCAHRLGDHLTATGAIAHRDDVFFLTRDELTGASAGGGPAGPVARRRAAWERQRRLVAPLTLGTPSRLVGDPIARAVRAARGTRPVPAGAVVGHPAAAGRATGRVRVVHGPGDLAGFAAGEVLVARATSPAWTPLFARAAAVVTDGGTLAAHASLVAREYGIPAVVGTGDATAVLRTGRLVTVDGTAGVVVPVGD